MFRSGVGSQGIPLILSDWLECGGTAEDGTIFGPPAIWETLGHSGVSLIPRIYRVRQGEQPAPSGLSMALRTSNLTLADLGPDVLVQAGQPKLPIDIQRGLRNFIYDLPVFPEEVAIPSGVPVGWVEELPISLRTRNALFRGYLSQLDSGILEEPLNCGTLVKIRNFGMTALVELLCVMESLELGRDHSWKPRKPKSSRRSMTDAQFEAAIKESLPSV